MRIDSLRLLTVDLAAQALFYSEVLGLPILAHTDQAVAVQAGHTRLAFEVAPAGWRGAYHFAFNIPENQLAAAKVWAAQRVPLIRNAGGDDEFNFANWDARAVYFYDAAGNIVELIARHALDNASDQVFDGRQLLGVSEVGLASPAVPATVQLFEEKLGVSVFRGSVNEAFAALGGEHGLLIIVREGRPWYPDTGVPADPLPVAMTVSVEGGERFAVSGPPYQVVPVNEAA